MPSVAVIETGRTERQYWLDLRCYRELFRVLAWRYLAVGYSEAAVGVHWALIRRLLTNSLITNKKLISKVYFSRIIV